MNPDPTPLIRARGFSWCLTHRKCAIAVGIMEIIGAALSIGVYSYASSTFPLLKKYIHLNESFLTDDIVVGILNTLAILSVYQLLLGIALLEGTILVRLYKIKFWLTSMFTYKTIECALIVGMMLAGCKSSEVNSWFFASVFIRGMEMILIYVFLEKETLKRLRRKIQSIRQISSAVISHPNASAVVQIQNEREEGPSNSPEDCRQLLPNEESPECPAES